MTQYGAYIVCNEYINEVEAFLNQFFPRIENEYTFSGWRTFEMPGNDYVVNLMADDEQPRTQHMTLEIYCDSMDELKRYASEHGAKIENFLATSTPAQYRYHYFEVMGPHNICKVEISYCEAA